MLFQHWSDIKNPTQSNSRETYAFKVCVNCQWFLDFFLIDKTANIENNYRYLTIFSSFVCRSVYVYVFLFIIHVLERKKKGNMPT